jgi:hypothetical protein
MRLERRWRSRSRARCARVFTVATGIPRACKDGKIAYAEYVKEITTEPNYEAALAAARKAASA